MSRSMQRLWVAFLALVPCFSACQSMQDVETLYLPEREHWTMANGQDDGHRTIAEFVPEGQKLASWRELMTIEAFDDRLPKESPKATMTKLQAQMAKRGGRVEWKVVEEDNSSVLYEWTIRGAPGIEDQGEIARLVQGHDALHRAAYAYKTLPLSAERRADRIAVLRNARVIKGEKERLAAMDELFPGWRDAH